MHNNHTWLNCFPHLDLYSYTFTAPLVNFNQFNNPSIFTLVPCNLFWVAHCKKGQFLSLESLYLHTFILLFHDSKYIIVLSHSTLTLRKGIRCQDGGSVGGRRGKSTRHCVSSTPFTLYHRFTGGCFSISRRKQRRFLPSALISALLSIPKKSHIFWTDRISRNCSRGQTWYGSVLDDKPSFFHHPSIQSRVLIRCPIEQSMFIQAEGTVSTMSGQDTQRTIGSTQLHPRCTETS